MNQGIIDDALVIIQIATLLALIIYVIKTWEMASATKKSAESAEKTLHEMKEARDQENAPNVIAYFDVPYGEMLMYLVIKNVGKSIAANVKLDFNPPLQNSSGEEINEISLIKEGISSISPGYEIRTFFDTMHSYFGKENLPLRYRLKVTYYGGIRTDERISQQVLDLSTYKGLSFIDKKGLHDLVKEVEKLAKYNSETSQTLKKISESLKSGTWIKNPDLLIKNIDLDPKLWKSNISAKLNEFNFIWTSLYGKKNERLIDPFLSDLQTRSTLLSQQISIMLSNSPTPISKKVKDSLGDIAIKLFELGKMSFYLDGGTSIKAFNKLGDGIIKNIKIIMKLMGSEDVAASDNEE